MSCLPVAAATSMASLNRLSFLLKAMDDSNLTVQSVQVGGNSSELQQFVNLNLLGQCDLVKVLEAVN